MYWWVTLPVLTARTGLGSERASEVTFCFSEALAGVKASGDRDSHLLTPGWASICDGTFLQSCLGPIDLSDFIAIPASRDSDSWFSFSDGDEGGRGSFIWLPLWAPTMPAAVESELSGRVIKNTTLLFHRSSLVKYRTTMSKRLTAIYPYATLQLNNVATQFNAVESTLYYQDDCETS